MFRINDRVASFQLCLTSGLGMWFASVQTGGCATFLSRLLTASNQLSYLAGKLSAFSQTTYHDERRDHIDPRWRSWQTSVSAYNRPREASGSLWRAVQNHRLYTEQLPAFGVTQDPCTAAVQVSFDDEASSRRLVDLQSITWRIHYSRTTADENEWFVV